MVEKIPGMAVRSYLFFGGRCSEALTFYQETIGAKVDQVMHFKDNPEPYPQGMLQQGFEDRVMHANVFIRGTNVMMSDGFDDGPQFGGFSLCLSVENEDEAKRVFTALSKDGSVQMPLNKTFFSPCFGMITDQFGLSWMIILPPEFA